MYGLCVDLEIKSILFHLFIKGLILLQLFFYDLKILFNILLLRVILNFKQLSFLIIFHWNVICMLTALLLHVCILLSTISFLLSLLSKHVKVLLLVYLLLRLVDLLSTVLLLL